MNTGKTNKTKDTSFGGKELSDEVQKAPPCLCHRCLVVAQGRRHFTVVYLHSSLFIQASKRTSGITFLTWSPQNVAVFPSTSATSERSLGQAWFFFKRISFVCAQPHFSSKPQHQTTETTAETQGRHSPGKTILQIIITPRLTSVHPSSSSQNAT